jgi:hypothetical protein
MTSSKPILYICPYCTKGRFTADDGFEGAEKHIRERHGGGSYKHLYPKKQESLVVLDEDESEVLEEDSDN